MFIFYIYVQDVNEVLHPAFLLAVYHEQFPIQVKTDVIIKAS